MRPRPRRRSATKTSPARRGTLVPLDPRWTVTNIADLRSESDRVQWVHRGYLARGAVTALVGLPKAGKTSWMVALLRCLGSGDELASEPVEPGKAIVVSEEASMHWIARRAFRKIGENVFLVCRPFLIRPTHEQWGQFLTYVGKVAEQYRIGTVVVDTFHGLAPVQDENDAVEVLKALAPVLALAEHGLAVCLVCHSAKSDLSQGRAARGSGAIAGAVDIVVELRRDDPKNNSPENRRTLRAYSRFDDTPVKRVIERDSETGRYTVIRDEDQAGNGMPSSNAHRHTHRNGRVLDPALAEALKAKKRR